MSKWPGQLGNERVDRGLWRAGWFFIGLAIVVFLVVVLAGCSVGDPNDEHDRTVRGHGDAPVGNPAKVIDQSHPERVYEFPDGFYNVATKCDDWGHRIYTTTHQDNAGFVVVIDDPSCRR